MPDFAQILADHPAPYYPIEGRSHEFVGVIDVQDIVPVLANPEIRERLILSDLAHTPRFRADASMGISAVFSTFEKSREEELPVFDGSRLLGFIAKARLYAAYKEKMAELSEGD